MTTAEIFADYLGLTPENAPWAYFSDLCPRCNGWCNVYIGLVPSRCPVCKGSGKENQFTATSPLAEKPTPGWLEVLVCSPLVGFVCGGAQRHEDGYLAVAITKDHDDSVDATDPHPTRAVALALLAADPSLRARCEAASDASEVLP